MPVGIVKHQNAGEIGRFVQIFKFFDKFLPIFCVVVIACIARRSDARFVFQGHGNKPRVVRKHRNAQSFGNRFGLYQSVFEKRFAGFFDVARKARVGHGNDILKSARKNLLKFLDFVFVCACDYYVHKSTLYS